MKNALVGDVDLNKQRITNNFPHYFCSILTGRQSTAFNILCSWMSVDNQQSKGIVNRVLNEYIFKANCKQIGRAHV